MNYAIDYASLQNTPGLQWEVGKAPKQFVLPYHRSEPEKSQRERMQFIKGLGPDDEIYVEMGPTHHFSLAVYRQGAKVHRVSSHVTSSFRGDRHLQKSETAIALHALACDQPHLFYPFQELDGEIAEAGMLVRAYQTIQDTRKRACQRFEATSRDLSLVSPIGQVDVEQSIQRKLANLTYFSGTLAIKPDQDLSKLVGDQFREIEAIFYAELTRRLNRLPIYQQLFRHIPQCGPSIAAAIIYHIADIRFFSTEAHLKHYAKLHQLNDGTCPSRKKGGQFDWSPKFALPFWLFAVQTRVHGHQSPDNLWRAAYEWRVQYEMNRSLPDDERILKESSQQMLQEVQRRRAMRWLSQKFCVHIWKRWNTVRSGGTYSPPNFACLRTETEED